MPWQVQPAGLASSPQIRLCGLGALLVGEGSGRGGEGRVHELRKNASVAYEWFVRFRLHLSVGVHSCARA